MVIIILAAIIILLVVFWFIFRPYVQLYDHNILYTGGVGSGKSFFSVQTVIDCYLIQKLNVLKHNIKEFFKFTKKEKDYLPNPLVFSTIPLRIGFNTWSCPLTVEHLTLQEKLPEYCVVFIDEINLVVSQMDFKLKSEKALNEFCTLHRHYYNSYLIANTQSINKIHWCFRYTMNESFNLSEFRKPILGLPILAWAKVRKITLGDEMRSVEMDDAHESKSNLFALFPLYKRYDTRCFSERAKNVPFVGFEEYMCYKVNKFPHIDSKLDLVSKTEKE